MKVANQRPVSVPVVKQTQQTEATTSTSTPSTSTPVEKTAPFTPATETATEKLNRMATHAATEAAMSGNAQHPLLEKFGQGVGLALGVIVTEALAVSKSWNAPLKGADGQPVQHIEGADRIGNHDLRKRHEEVVGPKVAAYVSTLKPGVIHDLLDGLARGATAAPGTSYRLEAGVSDWFNAK